MPVSPVSATSKNNQNNEAAPRLLVVSPSWLGDCVMAMPAIAGLLRQLPHAHVTILAKPAVAPLWSMCPGIHGVIVLEKGFTGMLDTITDVKAEVFDFAYILPNSFRSALIPWAAGIPGRRGVARQYRGWLLTETVQISEAAQAGHQSLEIADIMHVPPASLAQPPLLAVPGEAMSAALSRLAQPRPLVAFFPGAAHGPAKQWPADNFVALGRRLVADQGCAVLLLGSKGDQALAAAVAAGMGTGACNLAGATDLMELAAILSHCRVVVANDSGGMHLAAGLGVGVVGIFGLTDPAKTAPLGRRCRVLCAGGVVRRRDIAGDSDEGRAAMAAITAESVYQAVLAGLGDAGAAS